MRVLRLASRTAGVGRGDGLLPVRVLVEYSQTGRSLGSTSTMRLLLESVSSVLPLGSRLAKATPLTVPRAVKVLTISLGGGCVTSMARFLFSSEMGEWPLARSSAALGLLSW